MAQEVGVAYVTLLPSGKGFGQAVEGQVDDAIGKSEKKTNGFFSKVGTGLKVVGGAVAGVITAVGALAVTGGISRALNIEDAQAKLKGLGHDAQSVEQIMTDALASVKGTAFGLDAAATTAAAAVASGIKPGQELEKYLRLTADAATIAGVSMEEMGSIINKVQAKGKAQMEDLNRLTERGIPILQMLADEYGVTAEEMSKMVSRGEVDAERFRAALEKNVGGAALESGNTTRGAFANMMAALSRLGLVFVEDALGGAKTFFNEVTVILDGLGDRFRPWVDSIQAAFGDAFNPEGFGERFLSAFDRFTSAVASGPIPQLLSALQPILPVLLEMAEAVGGALGEAFLELGAALAPVLPEIAGTLTDAVIQIAPALTDLLVALLPLVPSLVDLLAAVLPLATGLLEWLTPAIVWVVEALAGFVEGLAGLIELFKNDTGVITFAEQMLAIKGPFGDLMSVADEAGAAVGTFVANLIIGVDRIKNAVQTVMSNVVSFFRDGWANASSAVSSGVNNVISFVGSLPRRVTSAVAALPGLLVNVGRQMIQGLINGVSSMISSAVAAVQNVGGAMLDSIKSFLGIHSPSRVFRDQVGKMVGLGLLAGIEDTSIAGQIDTAVNHLVSVDGAATAGAASPGFSLVVQGNVYGDPAHVGEAIVEKQRRAQAVYGVGSIR